MKFDKIMEWCYRALCIFVSAVVVAACVISCSAPVRAHAVLGVPDWAIPIESYIDSYDESIQEIQKEDGYLAHILNDPNVSNESKRQILIGNALQTFDFKFAADILIHWHDDGFPTDSPSEPVTVTGSGYAGFYYFDGLLYTGVLYPRPENWGASYGASGYESVCSTQHFNVTIYMDPVNGVTYARGGNGYINAYGGNGKFRFDASAVFQSFEIDASRAQAVWLPADRTPSYYSSPTLLNTLEDYFWNTKQFIGSGVSVSLPSGTVNESTPWEYYNNTLLPYLRNNVYNSLPSNIDVDRLLVFPNGYAPSASPDIFSPSVNFGGVGVGGLGGIIAGAGAIINVGGVGTVNVFAPIQGQIRIDGVQLQFPIDLPDSVYVNRNHVSIPTVDPIEIAGHVLDMISNTHFTFDGVDFTINADGTISISGTPYTLPIGTPTQPDTTPYEYMYEVPTMERIELVEPTIEPVGLSSFKDGITGFYGLGARLYYDLDLFRPLLICLGIAGVGYAISRIGGH